MLPEKLRDSGVVGAGGAGFPTYVKAQSQVEFLIANGAECEPLIHKDAELMKHFPAGILAGMTSMMEATGAKNGKLPDSQRSIAFDYGLVIAQPPEPAVSRTILGIAPPSLTQRVSHSSGNQETCTARQQ
jgi:hypothetical protein